MNTKDTQKLKRVAQTESGRERQMRARLSHAKNAALVVKEMRERRHWTRVQLAAALEMQSANMIGAIETVQYRKFPGGRMMPITTSLSLLIEIAYETGHDFEIVATDTKTGEVVSKILFDLEKFKEDLARDQMATEINNEGGERAEHEGDTDAEVAFDDEGETNEDHRPVEEGKAGSGGSNE